MLFMSKQRSEPRAVDLMMARSRAEVPEDRLVVLRQQRETHELVHRPSADVRGGNVADVVHVEAEERAHLGLFKRRFDAREALLAQALDIDALFPIHTHEAECF